MLLAIFTLYSSAGTTGYQILCYLEFDPIFCVLFISFAIKIPFHV